MTAGSLLVWNSLQPHCNYSNTSNRFRMVQYVKMFSAQPGAQGTDFRKKLLVHHVPQEIQESEFARTVLGISEY